MFLFLISRTSHYVSGTILAYLGTYLLSKWREACDIKEHVQWHQYDKMAPMLKNIQT